MAGAFEIPAKKLFATFSVTCKCGSTKIELISRDPVWEETEYRCLTCGRRFIKG